jgi:hypothetical protein
VPDEVQTGLDALGEQVEAGEMYRRAAKVVSLMSIQDDAEAQLSFASHDLDVGGTDFDAVICAPC